MNRFQEYTDKVITQPTIKTLRKVMTDSAAVDRGVATPTTPPALSVTGMSILPLVLLLLFTSSKFERLQL